MSTREFNSLEDVSYNIDLIDKVIIQMISERSFFVSEAAQFKNNEKVEEVIKKVRYFATSKKLNPDIVEKVYRAMIGAFIEQKNNQLAG